MNEYEKTADNCRIGLEEWCRDNDGNMTDYFDDGAIYGEDEHGDWIVGYGVIGSANIVISKDCVKCGGYSSKKFSSRLQKGLAELRNILENC